MSASRTAYDPVYHKRYRLDRELGRPRTVPAAPVHAHILALRAAGWSSRGIAEAAGLEGSTVHTIEHRHPATVRTGTARAILALNPHTLHARPNPEGYVPALGARRRIRALLALGWTHNDLRARSGVATAVTLNQVGDWVTRRTHDTIAHLYDALCMTPGPSHRTRARAAAAGYPPPLAWDDIDDPHEHPQGAQPITPRHKVAVEDLVWWITEHPGVTAQQTADRFHVSKSAVQVALARAGRTDLLARLRRNQEAAA